MRHRASAPNWKHKQVEKPVKSQTTCMYRKKKQSQRKRAQHCTFLVKDYHHELYITCVPPHRLPFQLLIQTHQVSLRDIEWVKQFSSLKRTASLALYHVIFTMSTKTHKQLILKCFLLTHNYYLIVGGKGKTAFNREITSHI